MADNLNFVSSNVNGLNSPEKCIKKFEYLKSKIHNNGTIFLQETHFYDCTDTQSLWNQLQTHICENLVIPCLKPPSAMFGFIDTQQKYLVIINHLQLIFKFNVYN